MEVRVRQPVIAESLNPDSITHSERWTNCNDMTCVNLSMAPSRHSFVTFLMLTWCTVTYRGLLPMTSNDAMFSMATSK